MRVRLLRPQDSRYTTLSGASCALTTASPPSAQPHNTYTIHVVMQLTFVRDVVPVDRSETGPWVDLITSELVISPFFGNRLLGLSSIC